MAFCGSPVATPAGPSEMLGSSTVKDLTAGLRSGLRGRLRGRAEGCPRRRASGLSSQRTSLNRARAGRASPVRGARASPAPEVRGEYQERRQNLDRGPRVARWRRGARGVSAGQRWWRRGDLNPHRLFATRPSTETRYGAGAEGSPAEAKAARDSRTWAAPRTGPRLSCAPRLVRLRVQQPGQR